MSATSVVVQGMVRSDGMLELDGKVPLPAGKVSVTLQPVPYSQETDPFFVMLREIRAARALAGLRPRSREEIDAQVRELRGEVEDQVAELGKLQDQCRRLQLEADAAKEAE